MVVGSGFFASGVLGSGVLGSGVLGSGVLGSLPSPSSGGVSVGPLTFRAYGLCIALGVLAAVLWAARRWEARGANPDDMRVVAMWGVPAGVIGARLYHVITDWKSFRGDWGRVFLIHKGGLGVWGGVALGVVVGLLVGRSRRMPLGALLDTVAPAIPLAQAIGRWGNWFNQELFGRPSTLPWALEIDPGRRPAGYKGFETFHPTFLYESLWNLIVVVPLVLWAERRLRLAPGRLFAVYVAAYTFARFFIERVRIDPASQVGGIRVNEWVAGTVFLAAALVLAGSRRRPKRPTIPPPDTAAASDPLAGSGQTAANPAQ